MQTLQAAATALQNRDYNLARDLLEKALKVTPDHPEALQLMGIVCRRLGNLPQARDYFQKSLTFNAAQPHTLNNLGITLAALGDAPGAQECYLRATALAPQFADPAYNLGLLLSQRAEWSEAIIHLRRASHLNPNDGRIFDALGIALREAGELQDAVVAAQRAAALQAVSHTAFHNLGRAHMALGHYDLAVAAYERAISLKEIDATWIGLGHAYRGLGRSRDSQAAYNRAVVLNPANPDAHRLLNEMIWQSGEAKQYLRSFQTALLTRSEDHRLRLAYANELLKIQQYNEASTELERALLTTPADGDALDAMARAKSAIGDYETAVDFHSRAMEALPGRSVILRNTVETLLKAGHHKRAHELTSSGHQRFPVEQGILALHTTAQRLLGDERYLRLADYSGIPRVFQLEPPPGYPDIETFCVHLKEFLESIHATKAHPTDQTLRGGTQTFGALFQNRTSVLQAFITQLRIAVSTFIAEMPKDQTHPLFSRATDRFDFSGSWSVRLSSGGYHTNHFHPMGWISSAFYVDVPDVVSDQGKHEGWLKMGETNLELGSREIIHRYIQPKAGSLVLFPSYFWHGTMPFESATPRLTIAFDVVPQ